MPVGNGKSGDWQERLLPFMARMIAGLAVFFFVASLAQLIYLHSRMAHGPSIDLDVLAEATKSDVQLSQEQMIVLRRMKTAAFLEANLVERRYHQANVLLMSRVWARYLGFVTGMVLAMVGASFILGRLQGDATEVGARTAGQEMSLRTASPGIVMCLLGVALMITTIVVHHEIEARDVAVYFGEKVPDSRPDLQIVVPQETSEGVADGED